MKNFSLYGRCCALRGATSSEARPWLSRLIPDCFYWLFNIFNIVFNISTLLNFNAIECFNISTSFQQIFQHQF
nr:MAG TPA: hypothetical protein [Microviridae sp.]